ncbi:SDR family oxidoreductase [Rhodococcus opacus]|uniref:SDR family oxidoreductase n=1 Tax=Rhodococcus opacus TaxID=37919 RepID=UPI0022364613|nr:SDR family oxidoreductase [Rhodococcus opacus]UZG59935.1 SDR family oxidoreductase [Rhodococcus opacus]
MKTVVSSMQKAGGGSIVNLSSVAGLVSSRRFADPGLRRASSCLVGWRSGPAKIRVNSVHPGRIKTMMVAAHRIAGGFEHRATSNEQRATRRIRRDRPKAVGAVGSGDVFGRDASVVPIGPAGHGVRTAHQRRLPAATQMQAGSTLPSPRVFTCGPGELSEAMRSAIRSTWAANPSERNRC